MSDELRFLVVDGYSNSARQALVSCGATEATVLYTRVLERLAPGCQVDLARPADGLGLPVGCTFGDYDGIVWTGSSLSVYEAIPEVRQQIEFVREVFRSQVPAFGSCWAAQIAVVAAGGEVKAHSRGVEFGVARKIRLTGAGLEHPLYRGKKPVFDAMCSHYDEITQLPPGTELLASNAHSRVQAVAVTHLGGTFWAPQYHPEYDLHEWAMLCRGRREALSRQGIFDTPEACDSLVRELETLHAHPDRSDLAWRLGLDEDVLDTDVRLTEVRNWIQQQVVGGRKPR